MAIPAWKLQLQQNIAKKKTEKQKQDEQRRIQMLPPWKRAAIEQQNQSKNVIIISNSSSINSSKPASTAVVSNSSPTKTVITNARTAANTNNVNTVNSNSQPRTVSIITANQKSPTRNVTIKPNNSGTSSSGGNKSPNHVPLKQAGKSKSVDVAGGKKTNLVSSSSISFDQNDSDGEFGVSDEHCISVHNNPFLRREKKTGGLGRPNFGQKVQDSTSPTATSTAPRVAWNSKSHSNDVSPEKGTTASTNNNASPKNNYIIEKQKPTDESKTSLERPSRSTERERKLSVHDIMKQFGRAASHEEKQKIRRQGSMEEPMSPRSISTHARDYTRERSPSPVKNRYRSAPKPRPKSSPVEISTSVILSQGRRSPATSPQPVRRATTYGKGANQEKAPAPSAPVSSNKVIINTSPSRQPAPKAPAPSATATNQVSTKKQESPAPKIAINDKSPLEKTPVGAISNGSPGGVVLLNKKHLVAYDTHDAGRTPPPRRKNPLPASAIIDLNTAGPIQEASGKPPVDPEQIAKEKAASIPKTTQNGRKSGKYIQSRNDNGEEDVEKPKPNTVSNLLGAFGTNKPKVVSPLAASNKQQTPVASIPYPEDFRRPKSWQAKQEEERTLESQINLRQTEPVNSEKERNEKNASISRTITDKPVELSPIPRASSDTISPSEKVSPIPNREIISSDTKTVTQNGHVDSKTDLGSQSKGKGQASQEMMEKARAIKKVKKKVNYEVIGGNAPTGKPSVQTSKSGRNRNRTKLALTFQEEPEEFEYQSEQSLLAEYGDEGEEEEDAGRHSSVSEDEEPSSPVAPAPSGFRENVPKATGGLQSFTPSYLRDLTPSMMREHQEALRRKDEAPKLPEPEPQPYDAGDDFSSAGSSSAAMLF